MKSFAFWRLFGGKIKKNIFDSRQPNHVKHLLSGLNKLLKGNFRSLGLPPGDPGARAASIFRSENCPPDFGFCPLNGISARGSQGRSDTALRLDSRLFALYQAWFSAIYLTSGGKTTKKSILLCPP